MQKNTYNNSNIQFFLDSGAFSAHSQNKPVSVEDYMGFIHEHEKTIDVYPVLDVIGNAKATWRNQEIMEDAGLSPMPVYHVEDDIRYLHRCLDYNYFCLGGMAGGVGSSVREAFLNKCFSIICDTPDGLPKCKVHGFGLASPALMTAFPFYSVDTSSWVQYSRFGILLLPQSDNMGNFQYNKPPIKVFVTERSPKCQEEGLHIKNLTPIERQYVINYIQSLGFVLGNSTVFDVADDYDLQENEVFINKAKNMVERTDVSGVCNNNSLRYVYNLAYFSAIADSCPKYPWAWKSKIRSFF